MIGRKYSSGKCSYTGLCMYYELAIWRIRTQIFPIDAYYHVAKERESHVYKNEEFRALGGSSVHSGLAIIRPSIASFKDPSVQACKGRDPSGGGLHGVLSRSLGKDFSTSCPSMRRSLLASRCHLEIRRREESSVAGGGMSLSLGVPFGAASAEASSLARLRSRAGLVGGMSAARIASSPFAELKVPATVRAIRVVSLSKPSRSHCCPSHMASTP